MALALSEPKLIASPLWVPRLIDAPLKAALPEGADVAACIAELQKAYESRGVTLVCVAEKWQFRTAPDLAFLLRKEKPEQKRLSRAAIETLALQP